MTLPEFKVVVVGDTAVGKTSLLKRYVTGDFYDVVPPTVGSGAFVQHEAIVEMNPVVMNLWDTAGQEKFNCLIPGYLKGSHGVIIVYDVTQVSAASLEKTYRFVTEITNTAEIILCGNKIDLEFVNEDAVAEWMESYSLQLFYTSAKTGEGVDDLFNGLAARLFKKSNQEPEAFALEKAKFVSLTMKSPRKTHRMGDDTYDDSYSEEEKWWSLKCCGT